MGVPIPSEPSSPFTSSSCDGTPIVAETVPTSPRTRASRLRRKASTVTARNSTKPANHGACGQASGMRSGVLERFPPLRLSRKISPARSTIASTRIASPTIASRSNTARIRGPSWP
jgi:hypothetical protein